MLLCPTCSRTLTDAAVCKCGTDLSLLQQIRIRADHLFNLALKAYRAGRPARALEYLEANALLVPFDTEARLVQVALLAQDERWEEVDTLIQHIQAAAPTHPLLDVLAEVSAERRDEG